MLNDSCRLVESGKRESEPPVYFLIQKMTHHVTLWTLPNLLAFQFLQLKNRDNICPLYNGKCSRNLKKKSHIKGQQSWFFTYLRYHWHIHKTVSAKVVWLMLPDHLPKYHIVRWTFYPALNQNGNRCGVCPTWLMRCIMKPVSLTYAGVVSAWLSRKTKLNRRKKKSIWWE